MAGHPSSSVSSVPAAAHVVGNAFVNQYYNVLHQSPQVVHRFYTDASRVTRAEAGADGAVDTVVSQSEIHEKVMALDYGDFKAEIITVDSQDSLNGGVLVMVTGSLYSKASGKRNFVQSFFLAPQEKGYFVLNDIFRYVDEESQTSKPASVLADGIPEPPQVQVVAEPEPSILAENDVREVCPPPTPEAEPMVEEIFESLEQVAALEAEDDVGLQDMTRMGTAPVIDEPHSPIAVHAVPASLVEETSEEAPKKSYASIVSYASILRMKENAGSPILSTVLNVAPKIATPAAERPAPYASRPTIAITQDGLDEVAPIENEVDGRSVYVKNLPINISSSQLEEEFGKFGVVKAGGVNIKSQKQGVCYAFVEYEESASAQTAIEVSPISIGGRQVYVEEKRQMGPRPVSRSGRLVGTGRGDKSFRSEGLRGRGSAIGRGLGGRGLGQDRDRETSNRGRGTGPVRSGNFGAGSINNGSDTINAGTISSALDGNRRDSQWGNGNRGTRRAGGGQNQRNGVVSHGSSPVAAV